MIEESLNAVYRERNQLVAALSKIFPSYLGRDEEEELGWRHMVYIELPTGQVSWHIPDAEIVEFFMHLAIRWEEDLWDGHTSDEKYRRLNALPDMRGLLDE